MKSLYLRIYLTLVLLLLAFAFGSAWLFQRHIEQERGNVELAAGERLNAMAGLLKLALPPATAPRQEQAAAFADWGSRLRMPIALEGADGKHIATTQMFERRADDPGAIIVTAGLGDGRSLELVRTVRPPNLQGPGASGPGGPGPAARPPRLDEGPWTG
ncbi:MAG TPA: two-component sensor histidine kinase, partial [Roseateles sp.]|nr:two-component sensor histidine kinase [Roseateles sp.]